MNDQHLNYVGTFVILLLVHLKYWHVLPHGDKAEFVVTL